MTTETNSVDSKVYEVGYLLLPSISEEQLPDHVSEIKKLIDAGEGVLISEENPKFRHLAYEMTKLIGTRNEKFTSAYFGWIKFEMTGENLLTLKAKLDAYQEVLRYLVIKTVRENTFMSNSLDVKDEKEEITPESVLADIVDPQVAPVEELDKSIDAMVAE